MERPYILAVLPDGSRMAYEISGAELEIDYEEDQIFGDDVLQYSIPHSPRITVSGTMVHGRIWKPGDTFIPDENKNLEGPRGELEG